jgi:GTP:adenosylcobinamide-phosphate guanylyltransferase
VLVLAGGRGTRLPTSGAWSKHMEVLPGRPDRIIDVVLSRLAGAAEVLVAIGHEASALTAHLAARWPAARWYMVAEIDDLAGSVADGLARLHGDHAVVVEGDVLVPARSMAAFLAAPAPDPAPDPAPALRLLAGPRVPRPDRATIDATPDGVVRAVRPSRRTDAVRWGVLAAACGHEIRDRVPALCAPYPPLTGLGVSMWHVAAARLLAEGRPVRIVRADDGGVNVNSPADLAAAGEYLRCQSPR